MEIKYYSKIAKELNLTTSQVEKTVSLIDEGNTVPFIARYRKEATNKLDEEQIRSIIKKIDYLLKLEARKQTIINTIREQENLTDELALKISNCEDARILEDLYLPFKPKKLTRATMARDKGLEPLAITILLQRNGNTTLESLANEFVSQEKGIENPAEAIQGALDIIAEMIAHDADNRQFIRKFTMTNALLESTVKKSSKDPKMIYEMYYEYSEKISKMPSHRILAINRAEKEKVLSINLIIDTEYIIGYLENKYIKIKNSIFSQPIKDTISDSYNRLISKTIEREIRKHFTQIAEERAINVFADNLKNLLLQPPLHNQIIMGIDPEYRTGCKIAIIDNIGKYLEGTTIFPHEPQNQYEKSIKTLQALIKKHQVTSIAIGNGTASRETEALVTDLIGQMNIPDLKYIIVDEAGASVYSASKIAKEEFPELEASLRGNISIARRLLDPLSELVKIDPKSIGVGQYQQDVNQGKLLQTLYNVVEDCVNQVGVNLNTASSSLLQHVSGLTSKNARNIVTYRQENGKFQNREALKNISSIGLTSFQQSAGFLRVPDSNNPLDNTAIHPESYQSTEQLFKKLNIISFNGSKNIKTDDQSLEILSKELNIGIPTLEDIIENLRKPGLDPRNDLPKPIFKSNILKIDDLAENMILKGTIRNVVDFGAFVDVGLKEAGLVHISQLANKFVKNPKEIVSVGDVVEVKIVSIDKARGRIALSMKDINN